MTNTTQTTIHQIAADIRRISDREAKPLPKRLSEVLSRAMLLTTISRNVSELGYTTAGKTASKVPPGVSFTPTGDITARTGEIRLEVYLAPIEHHISRLEAIIDRELGHSVERHHDSKTGDELDDEIRSWSGVVSWVVATKAPWLGSPRTIERRRAFMGLRPSDGSEREERKAA